MKRNITFWHLLMLLIAIIVLLPLVIILIKSLTISDISLVNTIFSNFGLNTLIIVTGVLLVSFIIGSTLALFTSLYHFRFKKLLLFCLILPLIFPPYVLSLCYSFILENLYALGLHHIIPSHILQFSMCIIALSLSLYPYLFLMTRHAIQSLDKNMFQIADLYGYSKIALIKTVISPLIKPWVVSALVIIALEVIADFGAVSIFNIPTFTTQIYQLWFNEYSFSAAIKLSSILIIMALIISSIEPMTRSKKQFIQANQLQYVPYKLRLSTATFIIFSFMLTIIFLGSIYPLYQLFSWFYAEFKTIDYLSYIPVTINTLFIGFVGSVLLVMCGLIINYTQRLYPHKTLAVIGKFSTLGYAIPGTVFAVAFYLVFSLISNFVNQFLQTRFGIQLNLLQLLWILPLIMAYLARFLLLSKDQISHSLKRIPLLFDQNSRLLKRRSYEMISKLHIPLIRNGLITAFLLCWIDIMKEMPITLMLRPFQFDTYSIKIYQYAMEGLWSMSAFPALCLSGIGIIPIILLLKRL